MRSSTKSALRDGASGLLQRILNSYGTKRIVDVCGALVALSIFSPIMLLCTMAIWLGGSPSVVFRQERVGRNGKPFKILKFTTMRGDAHLIGPLVTASKDRRVTRVGRIIRPCRLNELPQFINVLRGEMSIVGSRPEVPKYVTQWAPEYKEKILSARPGMSGLSTLHFLDEGSLLEGRNDIELAYVEEILPSKLQIDAWYITHRTLWMDLRILYLTLVKVLGGGRFFHSIPRETTIALEERA